MFLIFTLKYPFSNNALADSEDKRHMPSLLSLLNGRTAIQLSIVGIDSIPSSLFKELPIFTTLCVVLFTYIG